MFTWLFDVSKEVKELVLTNLVTIVNWFYSLRYYFLIILFCYFTFLILKKVWNTETAGIVRLWLKVSMFMLGLWQIIWMIYSEVGTHLVAYNIVKKLPYVEMYVYDGK